MSETIRESVAAESRMVSVPGGRLHVRDFPGGAPALVVTHGCSERAEPGPFDGAQHQRSPTSRGEGEIPRAVLPSMSCPVTRR